RARRHEPQQRLQFAQEAAGGELRRRVGRSARNADSKSDSAGPRIPRLSRPRKALFPGREIYRIAAETLRFRAFAAARPPRPGARAERGRVVTENVRNTPVSCVTKGDTSPRPGRASGSAGTP